MGDPKAFDKHGRCHSTAQRLSHAAQGEPDRSPSTWEAKMRKLPNCSIPFPFPGEMNMLFPLRWEEQQFSLRGTPPPARYGIRLQELCTNEEGSTSVSTNTVLSSSSPPWAFQHCAVYCCCKSPRDIRKQTLTRDLPLSQQNPTASPPTPHAHLVSAGSRGCPQDQAGCF